MSNPVTEYFNANATFESLCLKNSTWTWSIQSRQSRIETVFRREIAYKVC